MIFGWHIIKPKYSDKTKMESFLQKKENSAYRILFIDDQKFQLASNLKSQGFDVAEANTLYVEQINKYSVVACDITGVGIAEGYRSGAEIIQNIKRDFPHIYVIAYTASASSSDTTIAKIFANKFLSKDTDLNDWTHTLSEAFRKIEDPKFLWGEFRTSILYLEPTINEFDLYKIEQIFYSSVEKKIDSVTIDNRINIEKVGNVILKAISLSQGWIN